MFTKKDKYFYTGLFTLIAIGLLVLFLLFSGFFNLFTAKLYVETYFIGSVQGLSNGSAVKFHGVKIGRVEKISFIDSAYPKIKDNRNYLNQFAYIYVLIAINTGQIQNIRNSKIFKNAIETLVKRGLRCTVTPSGLTGGSYIALDFYPKEKHQTIDVSWTPKYAYIPSVPSTLQYFGDNLKQLMQKIQTIDFNGLSKNFSTMSKQITHTSENLDQLITQIKANPATLFWSTPPQKVYKGK